MILWHYTKGLRFPEILESGQIVPSPPIPDDMAQELMRSNPEALTRVMREAPIVWFSLNQHWEETTAVLRIDTATGKMERLSMEESAEAVCGLYRIGVVVSDTLYQWKELKKLARMPSGMAAGLYESAREQGANPNEWYGSLEPVPMSKWVAVQRFDGGQWIDVE